MMKKILGLVLAFLLLFPSLCLAQGPYIVDMHAYYRNPQTGVIEDSGKNEGIGQGMAEGVLHPQALYQEIGGRAYLTLRLHMMESISKVTISLEEGARGFKRVNYDTPQAKGDWKDFRFPLPNGKCLIRLALFVDPMGREVIFYGDMGKMTEGNTDFILAEGGRTSQKEPLEGGLSSGKKALVSNPPKQAPEVQGGKIGQEAPDERPAEKEDSLTHGGPSGRGDTESNIGYNYGLLTEDSPEIQSLEKAQETRKDGEDQPRIKRPWGPATRIAFAGFMAFLALAACGSLGAAATFYFLAKSKRRQNELREEDDHEDFNFEDF